VPKSVHEMLTLDGHEVKLSSPEKVYFDETGATKRDLVDYYVRVRDPLMRALGGRPVLMERYPDGASGKSFFQKRVPDSAPDWLERAIVSTPNGTTSQALVLADLAHVVWAVNLGCIGFHAWPYHAATADYADELRIDLDPTPGITFEEVREAAALTRELLAEHGLVSLPKTTGRNGIHVYVRLALEWSSYDVRDAAVAVARELERRRPDLVTASWWKEERGRRVFVDFNQNAPHKTVFAAWTVRPRPGGQVSTPFAWDELAEIDPNVLTMDVVPGRVDAAGDPWAVDPSTGAALEPQPLEPLLELVARDRANGLEDAPWPPVYPKMPNEPRRVNPSRKKKDDGDD
jgi:DNA ligase D